MPVVYGSKPVIRLERDGEQMGAWQCSLVNSVPCDASRSIFGVMVSGWPFMQPTQSFKSSIAINRMLGCFGTDCVQEVISMAAMAVA